VVVDAIGQIFIL